MNISYTGCFGVVGVFFWVPFPFGCITNGCFIDMLVKQAQIVYTLFGCSNKRLTILVVHTQH